MKFLPHILLIALFVGGFFYIRWDAKKEERAKCNAEQLKSDIDGVNTNATIHEENRKLSDPDIDRRLIADWLR